MFGKTRAGKSHCKAGVIKILLFEERFPFGLVWTVSLTVEIKLRSQNYPKMLSAFCFSMIKRSTTKANLRRRLFHEVYSNSFQNALQFFHWEKKLFSSVVTNSKLITTDTNLSLFVVRVIRRKIEQFSITNITFFNITSFVPFSPRFFQRSIILVIFRSEFRKIKLWREICVDSSSL